jgi:TATA-box binding protein (TBP) (component of TFIID and TFIIIB)
MSNWQLTATTILCDDCSAEVTILVYKDGQVKCTGASSPSARSKKTAASSCSADKCKQVADYKAKLNAEERGD